MGGPAGFFSGGDSSSTSIKTTLTATGLGKNNLQKAQNAKNSRINSTSTGDNSIALGSDATYTESGGLSLSGSTIQGNLEINPAGQSTAAAPTSSGLSIPSLTGLSNLATSADGTMSPAVKSLLYLVAGGVLLMFLAWRRK